MSISTTNILGIAGSLRAGSYNQALVKAAQEIAPSGMRIDLFDLAGIPLYNADLDTDALRPAAVEQFKQALAEADAVLFVTPEYNHSIPGVLQNAIDWASRPARRSPLAGKPVAMMSASPGAIGGARAQEQLKLVLLSTLALVMPHPGVLVGKATQKFDETGRLIDEPTRRFLRQFLEDFRIWTQYFKETAARFDAAA